MKLIKDLRIVSLIRVTKFDHKIDGSKMLTFIKHYLIVRSFYSYQIKYNKNVIQFDFKVFENFFASYIDIFEINIRK